MTHALSPPPGRTDLPVLIIDDQRRVDSANPAALALLGVRAEAVVGRRLEELLPASDRRHLTSLSWAMNIGGSLAGWLPLQIGADRVLVEFVSINDDRGWHELHILPPGDGRAAPDPRQHRPLSQREIEVLTLAARGFTTGQIAEQLHLSESTIETHVRRMVQALGAANRVHAVALAIGRGLIEPPRA